MLRNSSGVCPSSFSWRRLVFQYMMYASSSRLNESNESNSLSRWNSSFRCPNTCSVAALSKQLPLRLIDWHMFSRSNSFRHHWCRYCHPMSECGIGSAPRAGVPRAWRAGASAGPCQGVGARPRRRSPCRPCRIRARGTPWPGDPGLRDIGAELGERPAGVEVAFEQVVHAPARLAPVRVVSPPRVRGADPAPHHASHDPERALGGRLPPEPARPGTCAPAGGRSHWPSSPRSHAPTVRSPGASHARDGPDDSSTWTSPDR